MPNFTKQEMLNELREIIFQHARATSFIMDPAAGFRILQCEVPKNLYEILENLMDPEINSAAFKYPFSIDGMPVTRTVEQFYDYGLQGLRNFDISLVTESTEWAFAPSFLLDVSRSMLLCETLNGRSVSANKCLIAARAFFARLVLDGGERFIWEEDAMPYDGLTLLEVALLASLDDRTIRNATSKNAPNRLETSMFGSGFYVPREAALAWLLTKRGFVPTRLSDDMPLDHVLESNFVNLEEAGAYISRCREHLGLACRDLLKQANSSLKEADLAKLESGKAIPTDEQTLKALGLALGVKGDLFALRILEAQQKQSLVETRQRIMSIT